LAETKPAASTQSTWTNNLNNLKQHLGAGTDDISRITGEDIVAWKDSAAARGLASKIINASYLGMAKQFSNMQSTTNFSRLIQPITSAQSLRLKLGQANSPTLMARSLDFLPWLRKRKTRPADGCLGLLRRLVYPFDRACQTHDIEHRLTKPKHPSTNGQVERMNRTIKDATVKTLPL